MQAVSSPKISQGSAATEFRCGGRFYFTVFRSLSTHPKVKELLKSAKVIVKIKVAPFFMAHGVYWAHRAVFFAIAQLSCSYTCCKTTYCVSAF